MFFSSDAVDVLAEDHKKLRKELSILKDSKFTNSEKERAFERLVPNFISHSKREERVIYSYMKYANDDLTSLAFKGEEEHMICNQLVDNMTTEELSPDEWVAKAKVLGELLEHHLNDEENKVFPLLKKNLDESTDIELCRKYKLQSSEKMIPPPEVSKWGSPTQTME